MSCAQATVQGRGTVQYNLGFKALQTPFKKYLRFWVETEGALVILIESLGEITATLIPDAYR